MNTLIELYDERAIENVLAADMFRPKRIIFLKHCKKGGLVMIEKRNSYFVISKSSIIYWSFLLPNLLGVLYFYLLPMLQVLIRSFQSAIGGNWVGVRNYITVVNNAAFQRAITNTGKFTAICIPLLIVISLVLVVLLYSTPGIGSTLRSIFLMPMAVPAASVVLVWKVLFHENGLINGALLTLGGNGISWMGSDAAFWCW